MTVAARALDPSRPETGAAIRLLERLAALPVRIESLALEFAERPVADYPGGRRPTATVVLAGAGPAGGRHEGRGEHVAWTMEAHLALAARLPGELAGARRTLGDLSIRLAQSVPDRLARAAVECAAADLALRQAGESLVSLAGGRARPARWVASFDRRDDPVRVARHRRLAAGREVELKIDADAAWPERTWDDLATLPGIAVLDWKGTGSAADHAAAARRFPLAWLEDPGGDPPGGTTASREPSGALRGGRPGAGVPGRPGQDAAPPSRERGVPRLSRDATILAAADIEAAVLSSSPPGAINIKIPRVGGLFEALRCFGACERYGLEPYVGGMFEVGPGRDQARALASVLSPDGPNDLAPHAENELRAAPARWAVDPREPGLAGAAGSGR